MYYLTLSDYDIGKDGVITNKKSGRKLKPQPNDMGYLRVNICGKRPFVHRLVAEKYVPNPQNLPYVNHIDGNHQNNRAENLEWCSQKYNVNHSIRIGLTPIGEKCSWSKLKENDVIFIREHIELRPYQLAKIFDVTQSTIRDIRVRKSWKHI